MNEEKFPANKVIGDLYEEKASRFLENQGYQILEKNVNYRWGEIDLIVIDWEKHDLVFVEVRYRSEAGMLSPAESISRKKLLRLRRAIDSFLVSPQFTRLGLNLKGMRIDLVAFEGENVRHWINFV